MDFLRPNHERARLARIGVITLTVVVTLQHLPHLFYLFGLYDFMGFGFLFGGRWMSIIRLGAFVFNAIVFIQWFRRAYYNAAQYSGSTRLEDGWASGAWFIPFMNWVRPFNIMKEIWTRGLEYARTHNIQTESEAQTNQLLGWWWAMYLGASILGPVLTATDLRHLGPIVQMVFFIVAGVLMIKVIKKYNDLEMAIGSSSDSAFDDFGKPEEQANFESQDDLV